jgi:hypothetical protein
MSTRYGGSRTATISRQLMRQRQGFKPWTLMLVSPYSIPPNAKQHLVTSGSGQRLHREGC